MKQHGVAWIILDNGKYKGGLPRPGLFLLHLHLPVSSMQIQQLTGDKIRHGQVRAKLNSMTGSRRGDQREERGICPPA